MKHIFATILICFTILGVNAQNKREIAVTRAKDAFIATANGDVAKLKKLMTHDFYSQYYL